MSLTFARIPANNNRVLYWKKLLPKMTVLSRQNCQFSSVASSCDGCSIDRGQESECEANICIGTHEVNIDVAKRE